MSLDEIIERIQAPIIDFWAKDEKELESYIVQQLDHIFENIGLPPAIRVETQFIINTEFKGIIDILAVHQDKSVSVFEAKCTTKANKAQSAMLQCAGIGQLLLYKTMLEQKGVTTGVRLFLVSNKIHYRTLLTFTQTRLPISLLEVNSKECFSPYLVL